MGRIETMLLMGQNVILKQWNPKIEGIEISKIYIDEAEEIKCPS